MFRQTSHFSKGMHPVKLLGLLSLVLLAPQAILLRMQLGNSNALVEVQIPNYAAPKRLLPTPILLVGLPKTGTSSIYSFFARSGYRSSHYKCVNGLLCGLCIQAAIKSGKPPLKNCGDYELWAQMDVENLGQCYLPQIINLDILHEEAPDATFVLSHRNLTRWAKSVKNWVGGTRSMAARLAKCQGGPKSKSRDDLIEWHMAHVKRIRDFVLAHPTHALVEIDIENKKTGEILASKFGSSTSAEYWGHENDSLLKNASRTTHRAGD